MSEILTTPTTRPPSSPPSPPSGDRWSETCAALAAGRDADADTVVTFVQGDLGEGRSRGADPLALADAWLTLLERAPSFDDALVDRLLALGSRLASGNPLRGLTTLLREARPSEQLIARLRELAASDPAWSGAASQLQYWLGAR